MKKYIDKYLQTLRNCPNKKPTAIVNLVIAMVMIFGFFYFLPFAIAGNWIAVVLCCFGVVWGVDGIVSSVILYRMLKKEKLNEVQEKD